MINGMRAGEGPWARFFRPAAPARVSWEAIMGKPLNDNGFELTADCADCTDNYAEPIAVEGGEWGKAVLPGKRQ